ncbi:Nitrogen permease regulator 2 [Elasticomyces elasticus]|nr:Nitrogen permease regulator 2 [Elasticomyces elasticus]KAK3664716.1 Nitrogen permease regulator 2 [Elasticomyces elasticus]KAK4928526.1 Nitrogen permease regulator 2 [Elasticomyces elasticus]KAK5765094.1 Nitrogen permease regulator 2 [Elasticomyces elasticus]
MLQAIFYARFHPERGPSVVHQYPKGSIVSSAKDGGHNLVSFSDISAYIIAPYELCGRPFSICSDGYRILGFPISVEDQKYDRNRFTFNVCFVLDDKTNAQPWHRVVAKTAAFFRNMEESDGLLQEEETLPGLKWAGEEAYPAETTGVIYGLLRAIVEDLNPYEETCIRVDEVHVLNLRLEHHNSTTPPKVRISDVPLLISTLPVSEQWTCEVTLQRIWPHMDGVKHVQRIAEHADVELKLVKRAVRALIYHRRAMLLDLFHFQAVYTATADLAWFVSDEQMQEECCRYVADTNDQDDPAHTTSMTLVQLYTSLSPGLSLHDFVLSHSSTLAHIDIRRFITFGVIKGFLRRVHKYALAIDTPASKPLSSTQGSSPSKSKPKSNEAAVREFQQAWKRAALTSGWATPPAEPPLLTTAASHRRGSQHVVAEGDDEEDEKLRGCLDGKHCLDEICVALRISEKKLSEKIRTGRFGEILIFSK